MREQPADVPAADVADPRVADLVPEEVLAAGPQGLRYMPEFVSPAAETELISRISELPLQPFQFGVFEGNRRVISFGFRYDYTLRRLHEADPIPPWIAPLIERVEGFGDPGTKVPLAYFHVRPPRVFAHDDGDPNHHESQTAGYQLVIQRATNPASGSTISTRSPRLARSTNRPRSASRSASASSFIANPARNETGPFGNGTFAMSPCFTVAVTPNAR